MISSILQNQYELQIMKTVRDYNFKQRKTKLIVMSDVIRNISQHQTTGYEPEAVILSIHKRLDQYLLEIIKKTKSTTCRISSINIVDAILLNNFILYQYMRLPVDIQTKILQLMQIMLKNMDNNILLSFKQFFLMLSKVFSQYISFFKNVTLPNIETHYKQYLKLTMLLIKIEPEQNDIMIELGDIIKSMIEPYMDILIDVIINKSLHGENMIDKVNNMPITSNTIYNLAIYFKNYGMYYYLIMLMTKNSFAKEIINKIKLSYTESIQLFDQFNQYVDNNINLVQKDQYQIIKTQICCLLLCDSTFIKEYLDHNQQLSNAMDEYITQQYDLISEWSYRVKFMIDGLGMLDASTSAYYNSIFNV